MLLTRSTPHGAGMSGRDGDRVDVEAFVDGAGDLPAELHPMVGAGCD